MRRRLSFVGLLAFAQLALAPVLLADWLVLKDGTRIETRGEWRIKGGLVVFSQMNGSLGSLRAREVDLDASALATAKAKEPTPLATPSPPRTPVLVLTEKEIPPVRQGAGEAEPGASAASADGQPPAEAPSEPLEVAEWQRSDLPNNAGTELIGTVRNRGEALVTGATIAVSLYDEAGGLLVSETADLGPTAIAPGQTASFQVQFPGLLNFAEVRFSLGSRGFRIAQPVKPAGETVAPAEPLQEEPPPP